MAPEPGPGPSKFDAYAEDYSSLHGASIAESGEGPEYFARYKLDCLVRLGVPRDEPILDFGAGTGSLSRLLGERFARVAAFEPSARSLNLLRQNAPGVECFGALADVPDGGFSTAIIAGVVHHVPPPERPGLLRSVKQKLRPGGRVVIFEHNPLNPLTQRAVRGCAFDDDAVLLWPWELPRLLRSAGFVVPRVDYIVFFPHALRVLRPLEPYLRRVLLGAQTMTVATRAA